MLFWIGRMKQGLDTIWWQEDLTEITLLNNSNLQSMNIMLKVTVTIMSLLLVWLFFYCGLESAFPRRLIQGAQVAAAATAESPSLMNSEGSRVPFLYMLPSTSIDMIDLILIRALDRHKENVMDSYLRNLMRSLELIRRLEWSSPILSSSSTLSNDYQYRIQQTAMIIEKEYQTLQKIYSLRHSSNSYWTLALPEPNNTSYYNNNMKKDNYSISKNKHGNDDDDELLNFNQTNKLNTNSGSFIPKKEMSQDNNNSMNKNDDILTNNASYDSISQVVIHLVRDWSHMGRDIRHSLYDWVITQLSIHASGGGKVLIPGSGLGRLAYDIATQLPQFNVEANELSITMATACHFVLHHFTQNNNNNNREEQLLQLHPFAFDFMVNELDTTHRFQPVSIPDVDHISIPQDNLSFTVGDFVKIYSQSNYRESVDAIVTCFFLDTATNLFDYILTIQNVLRSGGVWIHVGPLQWHGHAQLAPSVEELHRLLSQMNFTIVHWSTDEIPIPYRPTYPSTRFDGYTPLRFVIEVNSSNQTSVEKDHDIFNTISTMRHVLTKNLSTTTYP